MLQIAGPARDEPLVFAGAFALTFFQCFGFAADKKAVPGKADKPLQPQTRMRVCALPCYTGTGLHRALIGRRRRLGENPPLSAQLSAQRLQKCSFASAK